ncbi:uncharacterized protein LOC130629169 isoform X2 [Hydractinia symbiolongicarpus]|nr:uncharacterized protein LOC130629169 isoform X2 [Hydractinia symbiolongicarpus]
MVLIQYKKMDSESGNWTSGLFCNTSIVERINGDNNQNIRCRLFHVKDTNMYQVQLVLESDSEINTTILNSSYHPANEAFFCYSNHDLEDLEMKPSDVSVTASWEYPTYDISYIVSSYLRVVENNRVEKQVKCADIDGPEKIVCTLRDLDDCTHYNVCALTMYNVGKEHIECRNVTTTSTAPRAPTGMKLSCEQDQENRGTLSWQGHLKKENPHHYFTYNITSDGIILFHGKTRNTSLSYEATLVHNASISFCTRCRCSPVNRIVLRSCLKGFKDQVNRDAGDKVITLVVIISVIFVIILVVVAGFMIYKQRSGQRNEPQEQQVSPRQNGNEFPEPIYEHIDYEALYKRPNLIGNLNGTSSNGTIPSPSLLIHSPT